MLRADARISELGAGRGGGCDECRTEIVSKVSENVNMRQLFESTSETAPTGGFCSTTHLSGLVSILCLVGQAVSRPRRASSIRLDRYMPAGPPREMTHWAARHVHLLRVHTMGLSVKVPSNASINAGILTRACPTVRSASRAGLRSPAMSAAKMRRALTRRPERGREDRQARVAEVDHRDLPTDLA